jgi:hypothetical protein
MKPIVAKSGPFESLPAVTAEPLMTDGELLERVALLDTGGDFGPVQLTRWTRAATLGQWTSEELLTAVDWLNLNHTGYVKIAHVNEHIEGQRKTLRLARMYCWQHELAIPIVAQLTGWPATAQDVERYWQDYRYEWLNHGIVDRVMASQSDAAWKKWATENMSNFRSEL